MSSDEKFIADLVRELQAAGLEAIIVGSVAAVLQGTPIMTADLDLLVRDTPLNRKKLDALGAALGTGRPIQKTPLSNVVTFMGGSIPVDVIFDEISGGLSFARVRARSLAIPVGELSAVVASLEDVIRSKEAAGRPKDLAQLPILRDTLRVKQALEQG